MNGLLTLDQCQSRFCL